MTRVQEVPLQTALGGSANKTISIAAPAAGNTLVLLAHDNTGGVAISAVTGGGVTWSNVAQFSNLWVWLGANSIGSGTTITVTIGNTYARFDCSVSEWSGMPSTLTADGGSNANSSNPNVTTPAITPTAGKPVLLLALCDPGSSSITAGPTGGFTAFSSTGFGGNARYAWQVVASASGSYQAGYTIARGYGTTPAGLYAFDGAADAAGGSGLLNRRRRMARAA